VRCVEVGIMANTDQQIKEVETTLFAMGFKKKDMVVITMGTPIETRGTTNLMKIHSLGADA
jgi:pyruvate kinase